MISRISFCCLPTARSAAISSPGIMLGFFSLRIASIARSSGTMPEARKPSGTRELTFLRMYSGPSAAAVTRKSSEASSSELALCCSYIARSCSSYFA